MKTEVWIFVPGTDDRYAISNLGHLKMLGRKRRCGRLTRMYLEPAMRELKCFFEDGKFGWIVVLDNAKRYFYRDELMKLFDGYPTDVDTSRDAECRAAREAGYDDWLKLQSEKSVG